jgi:hypothetical protein
MEWGDWFQGVAGSVIDRAAQAKYVQPYEIDKLRLQALGDMGYYTEGAPVTGAQQGTAVVGISPPMIMMMAAGLVLVMMMKD